MDPKALKFDKAIWDITGKGNDVGMVFEHSGEATLPVSIPVAKRSGMVVFCTGTSGFNLIMGARYVDAPETNSMISLCAFEASLWGEQIRS